MTSELTRLERRLILVFLLLGCLLAILIAPHYGQSWDDEFDADKGRNALEAYFGSPAYLTTENQRFYGPVHFIFSDIAIHITARFAPNWHPVDTRHVMNFAAFLIGLPAFYALARDFFNNSTSLILLALFTSQPLIFGHAFINQKDIPFMSGMVWTLLLGIRAVDRWERTGQSQVKESQSASGRSAWMEFFWDWWKLEWLYKTIAVGLIAFGVFLLLDFFWIRSIDASLVRIVSNAYEGIAWAPLQHAFDAVATDANKTPLSLYLDQLEQVMLWMRVVLMGSYVATSLWLLSRILPSLSAILRDFHKRGITGFILAGICLGIATAIRVLAPFFGLLVAVYLIGRLKRDAVLPLFIYLLTGITVAYLLWPFLWSNPVGNMLKALQVMSHFPPHQVLYRGTIFSSENLPWHYLPSLLTFQFTLPALFLILAGGVMAAIHYRSLHRRWLLALVLLGAGLPLTAIILMGIPIYDNFRQLLFTIPLFFIFAGFALEAVSNRISARWLKAVLALFVLLPGVFGVLRYHPYEYTFYNLLVGGTGGVNGYFEQDYWCTAYREVARYLNQEAGPASIVVVSGPEYGVRNFTRMDLKILPDWEPVPNPEFAVACKHALITGFYSDLDVVYRVERGGAVYALVQARSN